MEPTPGARDENEAQPPRRRVARRRRSVFEGFMLRFLWSWMKSERPGGCPRGLRGQMLPAVDKEDLARDGLGVEQETHRRSDVLGGGPGPERKRAGRLFRAGGLRRRKHRARRDGVDA